MNVDNPVKSGTVNGKLLLNALLKESEGSFMRTGCVRIRKMKNITIPTTSASSYRNLMMDRSITC